MNSRVIRRLSTTYLLPHLRGVGVHGRLLYCKRIGYLLRGCVFESSAFDKARFALHAFIQPLYVPADTLVLTFGLRLGSDHQHWWSFAGDDEPSIMAGVLKALHSEAIPLWQRFQEPRDLVERGAGLADALQNVHVLEAIAYSRILSAAPYEAAEDLAMLKDRLDDFPADLEWATEMANRVALVRSELVTDSDSARALLVRWRVQTLRNLGLSEDGPPVSEDQTDRNS